MFTFAPTVLRASFAALLALSLAGCSSRGTTARSVEGIAGGTAVGVAAGTVITVATGGCVPCGAALGGVAGAGAGFLFDRMDNRVPGR